MRDLIDSVLIGGCASYLPFWIWNNAGDQLVGALALIGITYIVKRWHVSGIQLCQRCKNICWCSRRFDSAVGRTK